MDAVDEVLDAPGRRRSVQFVNPLFDFLEHAGVGADDENGVDALDGDESDGGSLLGRRKRGEDVLQLLRQHGGEAVLDLQQTDALVVELFGVEQVNQLHCAAHIAAVIQDQQDIGRLDDGVFRPFAEKGFEHGGDVAGERIAKPNRVEDHPLVHR